MSTTTPSKESLKAARKAMWASRMRRSGSGWWPRLGARVMGAPAGAIFTISVRAAQGPLLVKAAAELGYDANEVSASGGQVTMDLVWTGTGYVPLSERQLQDLVAGVRHYGVDVLGVGGPRAGVTPLREWRLVAEHDEDAPALAAWFESEGYASGTVHASTERSARRIAESMWLPPVPWVLNCHTDAAHVQQDASVRSWFRTYALAICLVAGILLGGILSWRTGYPALTFSESPPPTNRDPSRAYWVQVGLAAAIELVTIVCAVGYLRVPIFLRMKEAKKSTTPSRGRTWHGAASMALGGVIGFGYFSIFADQILNIVFVCIFMVFVGVVARLLDPPDRRRIRFPTAVVGTLLAGVIGWAALADCMLAAGLHVPFGVAKADLFTRTAVLVVIVLPPALALLVGGWVFRLIRRQDRATSTTLVVVTLGSSLLLTTTGLSFVLDEASRIVTYPGQGLWGLSMSTQRVNVAPADPEKASNSSRSGDLYGVIGEVGDRAVLLTHPCGDGESRVIVQSAGSLSFEPVDSQACDAVRAATVAGRPSP